MHEPGPARRRPERLKKRQDFSKVMKTGRRARHRLLHLVDLETGAPATRVGFSVRKQIGGAVVRNHVKRRLRTIVRELPWRAGHDVVILANPGIEQASFGEIQAALCENARRLRLLETVGA